MVRPVQFRHKPLSSGTQATSRAWLAILVACTACHGSFSRGALPSTASATAQARSAVAPAAAPPTTGEAPGGPAGSPEGGSQGADEDVSDAVEAAVLAELGLSSIEEVENAPVAPGGSSRPHPMLQRGSDDRACLSGRMVLCSSTVECGRACGTPVLYRGCCCPRGMMDLRAYCAPRLWPLN